MKNLNINLKTITVTRDDGSTGLLTLGGSQPKRKQKYPIYVRANAIRQQTRLLAQELQSIENLTLIPILRGAGPFFNTIGRMLHELQADHDFTDNYILASRTEDDELADRPVKIYFEHIIPKELENRNIILIEDLVESGETVKAVAQLFESKVNEGLWKPASLTVVSLLDKRSDGCDAPLHKALFKVPRVNEANQAIWYCGYGMDSWLAFRFLEDVIDVRHPLEP